MNDRRSPDPVALACELVQVPSVTPDDHGCQAILMRQLETLGFVIHPLPFGAVKNFYARLGSSGRHFCFAGHSDVVTPGVASQWRFSPFAGTIADGLLHARGVCDMKGALAAMVAGVARFLAKRPDFADHDTLSFLITGDEEGEALDGTVRMLEWLQARGETLDYCLVGEPTSTAVLGDCIKNGRRGSLNGRIVIAGVQGHVAYPDLATNPIHAALSLLDPLARHVFDTGNTDFSPTSLQFTAIQAGGSATNVIPATLTAAFNIRFNTEQTPKSLEGTLRRLLDAALFQFQIKMATRRQRVSDETVHVGYGEEQTRQPTKLPLDMELELVTQDPRLTYTLELAVSGLPFRTAGGELLDALRRAVVSVTGLKPRLSTGGGTSDARFIARVCPETVEFGLVGTTMHKVDERCPVKDLEQLAAVYCRLLEEVFPPRRA
ncbi:MAG: succinyl-diaminopimelate desuccinylase [Magnetococcales bacterium]|nr:succinyl-diaminopimelate desuccinylase [Magnetococcales bacterium]